MGGQPEGGKWGSQMFPEPPPHDGHRGSPKRGLLAAFTLFSCENRAFPVPLVAEVAFCRVPAAM